MYHAACKKLSALLSVIAGLLFTGVLAVSAVNIILRNVLFVSWLSAATLLKMMFVWMVFIGASAAYHNLDHLKMDFFSRRFSKRTERASGFLFLALSLTLLAVMAVYGFNISMVRMSIPFETDKAVPTGYLYLSVPVCALVMILFTFDHLFSLIRYGRLSGPLQGGDRGSPESLRHEDPLKGKPP